MAQPVDVVRAFGQAQHGQVAEVRRRRARRREGPLHLVPLAAPAHTRCGCARKRIADARARARARARGPTAPAAPAPRLSSDLWWKPTMTTSLMGEASSSLSPPAIGRDLGITAPGTGHEQTCFGPLVLFRV